MIRRDYRIVSNFLLQRIRELQRVLFPVDPYETAGSRRRNVNQLKKLIQYLKDGGMIHVFPAGEVSSYKVSSRRIEDRDWNESFCRLIRRTEATVIPLYFHGRNSWLFQIAGMLNPYIRTAFLAREFVYPREKFIHYRLGKQIEPETIAGFSSDRELAQFLKGETYKLSRDINDG
jgi:putative hemolysin